MIRQSPSLRIVHTEASCGWGGQEIRVLNEASGMLARGHSVTLLCPASARILVEASARGVPAVALPIGKKRISGVLALRQWLAVHPTDVINTHSSTDTWLTAFATRFLRHAPPIVRTRHISAPIPGNLPTRWLYRRATRHVVTTGEALRQQVIDQLALEPARVTSVPTGVASRFAPGDRTAARMALGLPSRAFVVSIIATLRSWKGHRFLIEAFARLDDPYARLLIVGDGPQRAALEAQVSALGLASRVMMPGNQRDVLPWLHATDVFALPSYANEGVPQAILQAMACALPVISTPIGAIREAVVAEETGLLVAPQDATALFGAIRRLRDDPVLRARMGQAGRLRASGQFTEASMLDRMEEIFHDTIAAAGSAG